jgi:hypothetical protein
VYVEEVPSASQPIAGVGTNTAGFIGIVPDQIYIPMVNQIYDPVMAGQALEFERLRRNADAESEAALKEARDALEQKQKTADDALAEFERALETARTTATEKQAALQEAENKANDPEASDKDKKDAERAIGRLEREKTTASKAVAEAEKNRDEAKVLSKELKEILDGTVNASSSSDADIAKAFAENEDAYQDTQPEEHLLNRSKLRPYYLEAFRVRAEDCTTRLCTNFTEYTRLFGDFSAFKETPENPGSDPSAWRFKPLHPGHHLLTNAVKGFFDNGGTRAFVARVKSARDLEKALDVFESVEDVSILAAPGLPRNRKTWGALQTYCEDPSHLNVFAVLDPPLVVGNERVLGIEKMNLEDPAELLPRPSKHAAFYFPACEVVDRAKSLQDTDPARAVEPKYRGRTYVGPSGHVAGIYSRTDEQRGVHKAPANAVVRGATGVFYYISKPKQELLNPLGVNCIRLMSGAVTVWGARTMGGDMNGEWKYVNVRRLAGYLKESIERGTQWVVFEPNDPNLWSRIILNVTAFLTNVWKSGALFGLTPQEAFYVKCDAELNPPEVRDLGMVITEIGVAIVRPAEFVIFRITQSNDPGQS